MNKRKRITAVLLSTVLTASMLSANAVPYSAADEGAGSASYNTQDDWLHVEGDKIVDKDGNEVWLTGCNWFGYNVGSQVFDGVWSLNMHWALNSIADHGFNLLRVPMSTEILLQWKNHGADPMVKVNTYSNPELTEEGVEGGTPKYSFDIWNQAVEWCRENGIKIMMDIHSAETASAGHQAPLWYTSRFSTDDWLEALSWFADYYKNDDTIIAIDLKNEPHGKRDEGQFAKWDGSKDENNWRYAAERGAAACLAKNPNLLIMVEGIEVYPKFENGFDWNSPSTDYAHYGDDSKQPYHGAWWGGNFRGAREFPVDLGEHQSQLVYSPHDYGPLVYEQTWFNKDFTTQTLLDDYWYDTWAFLAEEHISPLLMGEWGGFIDEHDKDGKNTKWMTLLRDYMIDKHIHHTFWCFNENSGDTGGLIASDTNWTEWDEEKYALVEPALWQDNNGVFISLDHEIPLGSNGQSLSEYYGGGHHVDPPKTTTTVKPTTTTSAPTTTTTIANPITTTSAPNTTIEEPSAGDDRIYGDVDCDGKIKISDVVQLSRYVNEDTSVKITKEGLANADVDCDKSYTYDDVSLILKYIARLVPEGSLGPQ